MVIKPYGEFHSSGSYRFLSARVLMHLDEQTDRLPVDGFSPKFDRNLQLWRKDNKPNFIVLGVSFLSSRVHSQTGLNPNLLFFGLMGDLNRGDSSNSCFGDCNTSSFHT
ncbi:hypothetical protein AVEN_243841-1 [Araneus ventricosus]|uniref:Uncharacterized protein n=1 Tax=Araneus ventricosus TaxID=182803 RepID=A0A4Y2A5K2_ARAVE|nr:hypothetical protein AVEN_243841-1 [Araneus ventricosus]